MRTLCVAAIGILSAYGLWPYVSLYQIRHDVQAHDVRALTADFDWNSLREGLKEDIADGIMGEPAQSAPEPSAPAQTVTVSAQSDDDLPPFGSGFVNSMAGNMVDQTVTPQHLANTVKTLEAAGAHDMGVTRAFFTSPTSFVVAMGATHGGLRLRMDLVRTGLLMRWKVTRAWLPPQMLADAEPHAS